MEGLSNRAINALKADNIITKEQLKVRMRASAASLEKIPNLGKKTALEILIYMGYKNRQELEVENDELNKIDHAFNCIEKHSRYLESKGFLLTKI